MKTCTKAIPSAQVVYVYDTEDGKPIITVKVIWTPVDGTLDRQQTTSYSLSDTPHHRKLASRLVKAIYAGAALPFKGIIKDVNGKSFVDCGMEVMGKYMNADLKRIGY